MDKKKLIEIVGKNPLNDPEQLDGYKQLLGLNGNKPFECVGTLGECRCAFSLLKQKEEWKNDFIINKLYNEINVKEDDIKKVFTLQSSKFIPEVFLKCLNIKES